MPPPLPRWDIKRADWEIFKDTIRGWYEENGVSVEGNVEVSYRQLVIALHEAAEAAIPKTKPAKRQYKNHW